MTKTITPKKQQSVQEMWITSNYPKQTHNNKSKQKEEVN